MDRYVGEVRETDNLDQFISIDNNRDLNEPHLKHLMVSLSTKNLKIPIVVNEKKEVIDGQHRIEACKRLGYTICYLVIPGYYIKEVRLSNSIRMNWKAFTHLVSRAKGGNPHYEILLDFMIKHNLGSKISQAMILIEGKPTLKRIENGTFTVDNNKMKLAEENIHKYKRMMSYVNVSGFAETHFTQAFVRCLQLENFDFEYFIRQIGLNPEKINRILKEGRDRSGFKTEILAIHDFRNKKSVGEKW